MPHRATPYKGKATRYSGQYPDTPEFQAPWENAIQVMQGYGEVSTRKPLISEGFGLCGAYLLLNLDTNSAILFHLDGYLMDKIHDNGRSFTKSRRYDVFMGEPGEKIALPIRGGVSFNRDGVSRQMEEDGVHVMAALEVDSEGVHWGVLYRPETREVIINNIRLREALSYFPFPEIDQERIAAANVAVPLEERIALKENEEKRHDHAAEMLIRAMQTRNLDLFQETLKEAQDIGWDALVELVISKRHEHPLALLKDKAGRYEFSGDIADDEATLAILRAALPYAGDDSAMRFCIWRLCELAEGIAELASARGSARHGQVAHDALALASNLCAALPESEYKEKIWDLLDTTAADIAKLPCSHAHANATIRRGV